MATPWAHKGQGENRCGLMAHVAQLAEHVLGKDEVTRSIRVVGSISSLIRPASFYRQAANKLSNVLRNSVLRKGVNHGEGEI